MDDVNLRPYQQEGVRFLLEKKRALLGDDMGLGKTATALSAARKISGRTLVVCPSYVRGVWQAELEKWWPDAANDAFYPFGLTTFGYPDGPPRVTLIHYDILHAWAGFITNWHPHAIVFDECHALMSENSRRSKVAKEVSRVAEYVWGLTGTPLTNRPRDLWNVVETIRPRFFGGFFRYGLTYCAGHQKQVTPEKRVWDFSGKSNLPDLHRRLKYLMLRRTKEDVGMQLPPKTRQIMRVEIPAKVRITPNPSAKDIRASLEKAADAKLGDAVELIRGHLEAGHRVVAFTWRRAVAEMLVDTLREDFLAEVIHGGVSTLQRGKRIESAKSAEVSLLAATIDSSATGIDLSYADVAVFVEMTYEPHELLQAEARLHRFGQQRPVLIQYVIASGSVDELIADVVVGKLDTYEKTIGATGESLAADLRDAEEDIISQLVAAIEKQKPKKCKACGGDGVEYYGTATGNPVPCLTCNGAGKITRCGRVD